MSMLDASQQLIWVQNLYQELGYELTSIDLCGDNQGAIFLASNPTDQSILILDITIFMNK